MCVSIIFTAQVIFPSKAHTRNCCVNKVRLNRPLVFYTTLYFSCLRYERCSVFQSCGACSTWIYLHSLLINTRCACSFTSVHTSSGAFRTLLFLQVQYFFYLKAQQSAEGRFLFSIPYEHPNGSYTHSELSSYFSEHLSFPAKAANCRSPSAFV